MIFGSTINDFISNPEKYTICIRDHKVEAHRRFESESQINSDTIKEIKKQAYGGNETAQKVYRALTRYQLDSTYIPPKKGLFDRFIDLFRNDANDSASNIDENWERFEKLNEWVYKAINNNEEYQNRVFIARRVVSETTPDLSNFNLTQTQIQAILKLRD